MDHWCRRAAVVERHAAGPTLLGRAADCAVRRTGRGAQLGTAQACWRGALLGFVFKCVPCCLWGVAFGAWGFLMAPKPIRTPRTSQGEIILESRSLAKDACSQGTEDMITFLAISETISPSLVQTRKEEKPSGAKSDHGLLDTAESFFSLSDQSRDSDLGKYIPLTDSDIECSSSASILATNHLTCRRKLLEQPCSRRKLGTKLRGEPPNPQDKVCEMQWDYTGTQQAFLKVDTANNTLIPPAMDGPAETPSLELIYRIMVHNHEQAQKESRKAKLANRQLQLSIKKVVNSCQDIGTRIASMETRTEELET
ncbi:hypothetical protein NDU88_004903 [Pleurodeles waltl]|uniref:Uncharacterized protein n=1 Tax=Pleurodeles waltl TaxID=8319 RepID=A0AAV7MFC2_PLEWA|nr:hypothetical protein NDU88_004903 [Pleurodeles waltl]